MENKNTIGTELFVNILVEQLKKANVAPKNYTMDISDDYDEQHGSMATVLHVKNIEVLRINRPYIEVEEAASYAKAVKDCIETIMEDERTKERNIILVKDAIQHALRG